MIAGDRASSGMFNTASHLLLVEAVRLELPMGIRESQPTTTGFENRFAIAPAIKLLLTVQLAVLVQALQGLLGPSLCLGPAARLRPCPPLWAFVRSMSGMRMIGFTQSSTPIKPSWYWYVHRVCGSVRISDSVRSDHTNLTGHRICPHHNVD